MHTLSLRPLVHCFSLLVRSRNVSSSPPPHLPTAPSFSTPLTDSESALARTWLALFARATIPRNEVELTFARSSGPGGQNVNKVNTKATLRCALDKSWIPTWARAHLRKSPAYVSSSQSLLITSMQYRSQAQNVEDCLTKLHALIHSACIAVLPAPPDRERMARKEGYARAAKARRRTEKTHRAAVKEGRRGGRE